MSDDIHISPAVMVKLIEVARQTRNFAIAQIGEAIGVTAGDANAASLYCVVLALAFGELVRQGGGQKEDTAALINGLWRYCKWPLRLTFDPVH